MSERDRELRSDVRRIAGPLELGRAPVLDELLLGQRYVGFRSFHLVRLSPFFGTTNAMVLPMLGEIEI